MKTVLLAGLLLATSAVAHEAGRAAYLGNEGVLVSHGDTKVLFDAFYADSYGTYVLVPDETTRSLAAGAPPFDGVDAVLVSHVHGDHFSAAPALAYLRAWPSVALYGSSQVRAAVAEAVPDDDPVLARVHVVDIAPGDQPRRFELGDLELAVVAIPHAGGARHAGVVNLAFRATLDEAITVIHLGDADPAVRHFEPHRAYWSERSLHAAFPPYWFYGSDEGGRVLEEFLSAAQSIGVHVPASAVGNGDAVRSELGGDAFTDPGEARKLAHD